MTADARRGTGIARVALVALLGVATALFLHEVLRGGPWSTPILVAGAPGPEAYPRVAGFPPGFGSRMSQLLVGDQLTRVGASGLAGASPWQVYARMYAEARPGGIVELEIERDREGRVYAESLLAEPHVRRDAALALCFAITGLLIVRRAPHSPGATTFATAALVWAIAQIEFQGAAPVQTYGYFLVRGVVGFAWAPLTILAAVQFPEGAWPRDRLPPRWPWLFALLGITWMGYWADTPLPTGIAIRANAILGSATIAAILVLITRNFAFVGPVGRRQAKWVFLGCYIGFAPSLLGTLLGALHPAFATLWFASQFALVAIPISIYIAVTRSNLFDIDRLISGTATLTILLVAIGALAFTAVPLLAEQASMRTGIDATVAQLGLAVILAFAVVKVGPIVRPHVERLFFAERHAFQEGIDRLIAGIHEAPDPGSLARALGEGLDRLLHPEFCVVYARGVEVFAPVFARGSAITPHFDLHGALARTLAERVSAIDLERYRGVVDRLHPAEQAAIKGLGAAVLVSVVADRGLLGFAALGRKASGDIYTPTDLALLGMVGAAASASLMGFDDEDLLREARVLQGRLRQFVPASIAQQLADGRNLEDGERWLSILFADLRGYTSIAEGHAAEEVFRIVSRYTETVTRVVSEHGGTVVEFNGDGMMAVFGAPNPLPDKERRALAAARQIVAEVSALRSATFGSEGSQLSVGVGLATGTAYVGAIRSVDRHIWSAIGNTTNLAARLQAMSRELGAPIVIDQATRDALPEEARDFERRPETSIRGLRAQHDVYVLMRAEAAWG